MRLRKEMWSLCASHSWLCSIVGVSRLQVEKGQDGGVCLYQVRAKPGSARVCEEGAVKVRM